MGIVKKYKGYGVPDGVIRMLGCRFYKIDAGVLVYQHCGADSDDWEVSEYETLDNLDTEESVEVIELPQEPEQYIPELGEECEMTTWTSNHWHKCKVEYIGSRWVVALNEDNESIAVDKMNYRLEFRPIKTEREKTHDAALKILNSMGEDDTDCWGTMMNELYDAGMLIIPGTAKL